MKKINLNVVTRRGATGSLGASTGELSLALELRRGLGGRRRRLGGLLSGLLTGGLRGGLLGWSRRGGLGGFPDSLAGLGDRRLPWGWGRAA